MRARRPPKAAPPLSNRPAGRPACPLPTVRAHALRPSPTTGRGRTPPPPPAPCHSAFLAALVFSGDWPPARAGEQVMSSVLPPQSGLEPDPYRYGFRYVRRRQPDGTEKLETVPLTLFDVLHPQEDDHVVENSRHERHHR